MDEEKIVDEIKSSAEKYEIKTTADDIMKRYLNEKNSIDAKIEKNGKKKLKWLPFSLGSLTTGVAVIIMAIIITPPASTSNSNSNTNKPTGAASSFSPSQSPYFANTRNQTAFQVFSSVNLVNNLNSPSTSPLLKKRNIDETTFKEVATTFNSSYSTVEQLLSGGLNLYTDIKKGNFEGKYRNYEYKMIIEVKDVKYTFLSNMSFSKEDDEVETGYYGEIVINSDESWKVQINEEKELNDNETEIEMQIDINENERISIEQEYEQEEKEYVYTYFKNEKQVYKEKVEVEKYGNKLDECHIEIEKNNNSFIFDKITMSNDVVNSSYKYGEYEGEFYITKDIQSKKFVDKETNIEINI